MSFGLFIHFFIDVIWCYVGIRWFVENKRNIFVTALGFGIARFTLSFLFGFILFYASMFVQSSIHPITLSHAVSYILFYIPFTWISWSIIGFVMTQQSFTTHALIIGAVKRHILWRLYGTMISVMIELPQSFIWQSILRIGGDGNYH